MKFKTKKEREDFIMENIKLVDYVVHHKVRQQYEQDYDYDDLKSAGCIGLLKAVDTFDENKGYRFSTYAIPKIYGEILYNFRSVSQGVRYGRALTSRKNKVNKLLEIMNEEDVAKTLNITMGELKEAMLINTKCMSFNVLYSKGDDYAKIEAVNVLKADYNLEEHVLNQITVDEMLKNITEKEKIILKKYYVDEKSQAKIGEEVGLSQVQISRILRSVINRLQEEYKGA